MSEEQLPAIEEMDFERESVLKLYQYSSGGINPLRWERARDEVHFEDVVSELTGHRDSVIRCPFHGRDSTPSFHLYSRTNDAFCFGCPPGEMYYDSITFVSKYQEISRVQALQWIEKQFNLPKLSDVYEDDEEEQEVGELGFWDLSEPFILRAIKDVHDHKDVELAEDYIRIYFSARTIEKAACTADKEHDEEAPLMHSQATLILARVLGKEKVAAIAGRKV